MFNRVRRYSLRDKDSIRKLCLDNCDSEDRSENTLKAVLCLYCDYYLENESDTVYVAVDENDEIIGYLLCAPDYGRYKELFGTVYCSIAENYGVRNYITAKMNMIPYAMFAPQYPAHFHIDVAEEYQRQGIGTKMIEAAKRDLLNSGVTGMMLVCGEDNKNAQAFYEKNGFKKLITTSVGVSYGMELEKK